MVMGQQVRGETAVSAAQSSGAVVGVNSWRATQRAWIAVALSHSGARREIVAIATRISDTARSSCNPGVQLHDPHTHIHTHTSHTPVHRDFNRKVYALLCETARWKIIRSLKSQQYDVIASQEEADGGGYSIGRLGSERIGAVMSDKNNLQVSFFSFNTGRESRRPSAQSQLSRVILLQGSDSAEVSPGNPFEDNQPKFGWDVQPALTVSRCHHHHCRHPLPSRQRAQSVSMQAPVPKFGCFPSCCGRIGNECNS
eukprot:m.40082 g.40082  ORF g.40082 m.40082 type:complete len:255 (+) comp8037_c0_seq1:244-1008(+)